MLLNKDSAWSQNILSEEDAVSGFRCLIDRNMVRELINLMKNRKAPGSLEFVRNGKISRGNENKNNSRPDEPDHNRRTYCSRVGT